MADIDDYAAFIAVVDKGSLTAAARSLGRSLQVISRALARLERELGVELVRRTTRRLQPTPAGLAFQAKIKAALSDIDLARAEAERHGEVVSGRLRIGASVLFGPSYVVPVAAAFMRRWSGVEAELVLMDALSDLIEERLDLAVRIGELPTSRLRARLLARLRRVAFAAPSYISAHGAPRTPQDLSQHQCVVRTFGPEGEAWPLTIEGRVQRLSVRGHFKSNDAAACNEAVANGLGIGLAPFWQVRRMLDEGRVELVLTDFEPPPVPVHAVWVATPALPTRTRLFIDTLVARFAAERW
jgi:DNA-binding transcriptional LysR family regulator